MEKANTGDKDMTLEMSDAGIAYFTMCLLATSTGAERR